ncbi:MAG: response regulator [Bacteroides sp.]|nr:response regulator [Bacteroides sp.]
MLKRLLFLLLVGLSALSAASQEADRFFGQYNFNFISERAGLPYSFVDDIMKDSDGYIWVATHGGLGRFDGYGFLNFTTQTRPVALKSDFVRTLCEDNHKRLWVASEGGLDIIDLKSYRPVRLELPPESRLHEVMNQLVHTIYKDSRGNIWLAAGKELWCIELDGQGGVAEALCLQDKCQSPVHAVTDMGGTVCAGINNEVCSISRLPDGSGLRAEVLSDSLVSFSPDWRILCMQVAGDDLWIGSNRGLFRYNHAHRSLKRYRYSTHRPGMLSQAYITDIGLTAAGHLIVSTLNGLNVYHRKSDTFSFIRQTSERTGMTINSNAINCLFTEGETIWLGTETGGINLLSPKRLRAELLSSCPLSGSQTGTTPVNALAEDAEGNLWLALVERGLMKWDRETATCQRYLFSPGNLSTLSNNTLNGLLVDSDNRLWGYTWGVGINELDLDHPGSNRFKRYTREEMPTLQGDFVSSACEDLLNRGIWFGSTRGLQFYDKQTGSFTRVTFEVSDNEFEAIHALMIDRKQRLWVGTTQGLFVMQLASFAQSRTHFDYTYYKYKLDNPDSKQLEKINSILEDKAGNIWLGGNGTGLYRLAGENGGTLHFQNYTMKQGLPGNTIIGMAEDARHNLWLMMGDGLTRMDVKAATFTNYTQADGLPATQYYTNGILYSPQWDLLYLATTDGLLLIHPDGEEKASGVPAVHLSSLSVAGTPIHPSAGYLEGTSIRLHEKESRFNVGFTTQDYDNSSRIRFAYRLKGYEPEWTETQPGDCMARYTFVPAGSYTLQVKATDDSGHWSERITEVEVSITPYFYKSPWFYLLLLLLGCAGVWLFFRRKTRRYREQRARLEEKVKQRTQELAVQNQQLESMARHVKEVTEEKIAFFINITHEFRTPVTLIHGPIEQALKLVEDGRVKEQLEIAGRNAHYLLSLVNELMDFRKLDMDKVTPDLREEDFPAFLSELLLPFEAYAKERNIRLRTLFRLTPSRLMMDAAYMKKALINLVSNAIKFTPRDGRINIYVASVGAADTGGRRLYINVSDTGSGIVSEESERIFERFYQSKQPVNNTVFGQSGTGIGLFLCRKIVEMHGGEITARNNHRHGASFRILMPLVPAGTLGEEEEIVTPHTPLQPSAPTGEDSMRETILVVEDNGDMRRYIISLLEKEYRLLEAENGEEALRLLQRHGVDLIVSDLMMPVMDGMELSRRVKENFSTSHIPLLILTALRSEEQEKQSFEIGVDEYLCKPFDGEILTLRIRNILSLRNKYRQHFSNSNRLEELHIKEQSRDENFVKQALQLMKEHYADPAYTLENFVRDMGYSKTLVNRKMQELTGQPIGQFMKSYRLNMARTLIRERPGGSSVSDIAYAVGFNDPKYFTKCFKEFFGYLPSSELRK